MLTPHYIMALFAAWAGVPLGKTTLLSLLPIQSSCCRMHAQSLETE